ncbi:MAG: protein kinase [Myxococcota bacterium]
MGEGTGAPRELAASQPALSDKLTIIEQIGEGGMARIYLARSRGIGGFEKLVVVKKILPRLAEDAEFIARFFQEARLAATLDHPNIVAVYDVDQSDGAYFYSMEYVRGRDLQQVLRRARAVERTLQLPEIIAIVTGLCAGLHHAHTRCDPQGRPLGIVHRDVSPSNILVSFEGAIKLSDFGVAKARTGMVSTVAGTLRGKIPYMSPEKCQGAGLDQRSDVYAAGALLWELLGGRRLHTGDSEIAMLRHIAEHDAPPIGSVRPDVPPALERIVAKALARSPAERHGSADALGTDLEEFARQHKLPPSGRAVAELMTTLFAEDRARETSARQLPPTLAVAAAREEAGDDETPPTGTVAPPSARGVGDAGSATTDPSPRAGGRGGLAIGLVLGTLLGGGGLYLASARDAGEGSDARTERPTQSPVEPPNSTPKGGVPVARPSDTAAAAPAPTSAVATPPTEPTPDATPQPTSGDKATPRRKSRPRKRTSRRRGNAAPDATKSKGDKPLDLDSALPPGFDPP